MTPREARKRQAAIRKLKDAASKALRKGKLDDARDAYEELEKLDPEEGQWPQRLADALRRMDDREGEVRALGRAADRWADGGFLLKAIAACKMVLDLEPEHTRIQERLAELYSSRGIEPKAADAPAAEASGLEPGQPLEEIVLTEVVPTREQLDLELETDSSAVEVLLTSDPHSHDAPAPDGLDASSAGDFDPAALARSEIRRTLPRVPLFSSLDAGGLRLLIDGTERVQLREGEVLFEEGDLGDALYVVAEGAVVPVARSDDGRTKRLAVLEEGTFFGETALLANQPRNARIEALVDSQLLAVDRRILTELLSRDPEVLSTLLGFFRDRLIERLALTSSFFGPLDATARRELLSSFRFLEVEAGGKLIAEGRPAPALFVLLAGEIEAIQRDEQGADTTTLATLKAGHVFGEMSILEEGPAVASCVASRKCWVLALAKRHVAERMALHPEVRAAATALAEQRRAENTTLASQLELV
ncbi:MAG: cyclic nucleotide-binding domain-containing protein [bacterium]|nr:cyclic nucleotide-binding domain-containing protein [bacterium]